MTDLVLRYPTLSDAEQLEKLDAEFVADDFQFTGRGTSETWPEYFDRVGQRSPATQDRVPCDFLVAVRSGEIVGRISIRYELNDYLYHYGGHIGYGVARAHRRQGYATWLLEQGLERLYAEGVERVLVTCADTNYGSQSVIERCGGVLENTERDPSGRLTRRYWITRQDEPS